MIELRWKLEPPMPNKGREDRWTLQYRQSLPAEITIKKHKGTVDLHWSDWGEWIDVPYFSPE